jgi:hypothetical protein
LVQVSIIAIFLTIGIYSEVITSNTSAGYIQFSAKDIISPISSVSLVVTSCNRADLLFSCLDSIFTNQTYKFNEVIVSEASGIKTANLGILQRYPFIKYYNGDRISQVVSIDLAYSKVNPNCTFILHFEEDWIVYKGGFVEKSITVLNMFPNISVVSLHKRDSNLQKPDLSSNILSDVALLNIDAPHQGGWGFFTWGAGLRRVKDYQDIGCYQNYNATWKTNAQLQIEAKTAGFFIKKHFIHREWKIGWYMRERGFRVAMFNDSTGHEYARHIGGNRHVKDEKKFSPFE